MPDPAPTAIPTVVNFFVTKTVEARTERADGLPGKLLARFLPDLSYRITPKNKPFVEKWMAEGVAHIGVQPGSAAALGFRAKGSVKTGKGK